MYVLKENETEKKRSKILKPLKKSIEARLLKKGIKFSIEHEKEEKKKKPMSAIESFKQSKKVKTLKIEKPEKKEEKKEETKMERLKREKPEKKEKALKKKKNVQPRQTTSQRVQSTLRSFIDELSAQGIQ